MIDAGQLNDRRIALADALLTVMGSDLSAVHGPERAVNGVTRRLADISAAARDLGWTPEIGLSDGLDDLVTWWRHAASPAVAG